MNVSVKGWVWEGLGGVGGVGNTSTVYDMS
jgi:hypothetical protein